MIQNKHTYINITFYWISKQKSGVIPKTQQQLSVTDIIYINIYRKRLTRSDIKAKI